MVLGRPHLAQEELLRVVAALGQGLQQQPHEGLAGHGLQGPVLDVPAALEAPLRVLVEDHGGHGREGLEQGFVALGGGGADEAPTAGEGRGKGEAEGGQHGARARGLTEGERVTQAK